MCEKARISLLPTDAIESAARVMTGAAESAGGKHNDREWEKGNRNWNDVYDSLQRHLIAWEQREDFDAESGCLHMAHVACRALELLACQLRGIGNDDRPQALDPESGTFYPHFEDFSVVGIDPDSPTGWKNHLEQPVTADINTPQSPTDWSVEQSAGSADFTIKHEEVPLEDSGVVCLPKPTEPFEGMRFLTAGDPHVWKVTQVLGGGKFNAIKEIDFSQRQMFTYPRGVDRVLPDSLSRDEEDGETETKTPESSGV